MLPHPSSSDIVLLWGNVFESIASVSVSHVISKEAADDGTHQDSAGRLAVPASGGLKRRKNLVDFLEVIV